MSRGEAVAAGAASQVKLVHPDPRSANAVTALRNADGNLQLTAWSITSTGQVTRRDDAIAGRVKQVALTPFPNGKGVVTATRGNDDALKLIAWKLTGALDLVRGDDANGGAVNHQRADHPQGRDERGECEPGRPRRRARRTRNCLRGR